jgi:hypothetical protein
MITLAKLMPLNPALEAAGICDADYHQDQSRPPTTMVGETPYVEERAWQSFMRVIFARACFNGAGYAGHEHPRWCRPGVLPADLLEDTPPDGAPATAPEPVGLTRSLP